MKNTRLRPLLLLLLLVLLLAAVANLTEWTDKEVRADMQGEAADNRWYVTQELARRLGAQVIKEQHGLVKMPPAGATLVLDFNFVDVIPEHRRALQAWVEQQGGHLVLPSQLLKQERSGLSAWVPVAAHDPRDDDEDDDEDDEDDDAGPVKQGHAEQPKDKRTEKKKPAPTARNRHRDDADCIKLQEPAGVAPAYADRHSWMMCDTYGYLVLEAKQPPRWAVENEYGMQIVRVPHGRGSVTVVNAWGLFNNYVALKGDNTLLIAAALQLRPGTQAWFLRQTGKPDFVTWLWDRAWPALSLTLLALGLALWRGAPRFGPPAAVGATARRSMAEQIAGTGQFLWRHGPAALHAAQLRALDETAKLHLPHYAKLDLKARAAAVAKATGLQAAALEHAFAANPAPRPGELPRLLILIETARRRLHQGRRGAAAASTPKPKT